MTAIPTTPALRDPVVIDGTKYRIRTIAGDGTIAARTSFGDRWASTTVSRLAWDKLAGVWREAAL